MAAKTFLKSKMAISLLLVVLAFAGTVHAKIIYVDGDATGANNGSSWADAYNYLQDALAAAYSGDEIRVAQGIYTPDSNSADPNGSGDREATFQLINGVTLKGGYVGSGALDPNSRDIELYETILSGDLNGDDVEFVDPCDLPTEPTRAENSYRVVSAVETDETAVLDGFTITAGNANGKDWPVYQNRGGGVYTDSASPTLTNCTFSKNSATGYGGGICSLFSSPTVTNCTFNTNTATKPGGGMCNIESSPKVTNCTFSSNSASYGGGMYNGYSSNTTVNNCTFTGNSAEWSGGGICGGRGLINKCTIIGNTAYYGGGLAGYGGVISDSTISGNKAEGSGGGIRNDCATPTVSNCIISDNTAGNCGGGICNYGDTVPSKSTLISCTVSGNSAKYGGGIYNIENGHATLRSCILIGNTAELGAAIYSGGWTSATLTNCTLSGNYAENSGGAIFNYDELALANCILWGNIPDEITGTTSLQLQNYNNIMGGWPGVGNIDEDPCFVQPGYWDAGGTWVDGDYHLMFDSLCMNAGDPNYTLEPNETDLDGNPRVMGGRIDMGAYESSKQAPLFVVSADSVVIPEGGTAKFKVALESDPLCTVEVTVSRCSGDSDITVESGEILTFDSFNYSKPQTVTLAAAEDVDPYNGTAIIWVDAPGFALTVVIVIEGDNDTIVSNVYVDTDAPGANDGASWRDAFTDLQDALTYTRMVPDVAEIRVSEGIYKPDQGRGVKPGDCEATFSLTNGVAVKGGYAGFGHCDPDARNIYVYETILSGDLNGDDEQTLEPQDLLRAPCRINNSLHVVSASGTDFTTVLDGFTISGGNGRYGGGMYNRYGNPTIINCTFRRNSANEYGGGIYNGESSATLTNCTFTGNWAGQGGGIHTRGTCRPTISNCIFINNWVSAYGGGIYNYHCDPTVIGSTFIGNSAVRGGGIYNGGSGRLSLANCIFSRNSSHYGGGTYSYYGVWTLVNCIFTGNSASRNGGAVFNHRCSPILTNCTLSGNMAEFGAGIYNRPETKASWRSAPELANCILWANADSYGMDEAAQIYNGKPVFNYCCIQGWTGALGGTGNIDADPLFIDPGYWDANGTPEDVNDDFWVDGDYSLLPDSPCIDAGINTALPRDTHDIDGDSNTTEPVPLDLDGYPRISDGDSNGTAVVDMGAYEYSHTIPAKAGILPRTINLTSKGNWVTCYIWLSEEYNVTDIDPNSIFLENEIEPQWFWCDEEEQVVMVRFDREDVQAILDIGDVELTITGQLTDGTAFIAADTIKVIGKAGKN